MHNYCSHDIVQRCVHSRVVSGAAQANRIHPLCLWADVVCVSFSQATYTVPEDIGTVEIVVEADKDFTFPFQVEVSLSPDTAQCKHFSCKCHI